MLSEALASHGMVLGQMSVNVGAQWQGGLGQHSAHALSLGHAAANGADAVTRAHEPEAWSAGGVIDFLA